MTDDEFRRRLMAQDWATLVLSILVIAFCLIYIVGLHVGKAQAADTAALTPPYPTVIGTAEQAIRLGAGDQVTVACPGGIVVEMSGSRARVTCAERWSE